MPNRLKTVDAASLNEQQLTYLEQPHSHFMYWLLSFPAFVTELGPQQVRPDLAHHEPQG